MNSTRAGRQVYCVVTDEYGISEQTNTVTLNMANTVMITKQPVTQTVAMGMVAVVDFTATGDGLTYKWYFRNRDYTNFHYTSTYTDNIYRAIMSDERQGREVYCIVTDAYGNSVKTNTVAINAKSYTKITYPDNTEVINAYDANNNLLSVTDWENRVTAYTYDANNRVIGVTKPDGSVTTTVYDNKQRVVSTTEKTASGTVITGFEYVYDALSRIVEEKHLADNTKICYTYDSLSRVTNRTVLNEVDELISSENYSYDAAGNITQAADSCFQYDANNRLTVFNGDAVTYDLDGNMLSNGAEYDSANRLISAGNNIYTYNVEDVRIRNLCGEYDTTYVYNTNCKLSQLLCKTTNGITTKYIYGLGLIGEEKCGEFKTYHFDYRGSTVAITDECGNITDTFKYDTYGKMVEHIGNSFIIFGYNGRDGVVTDKNGLIYMRARYYSPEMRRFVNADIIHGEISDSTSLNRYAYVNGNPVSFVDPFGLSAERGNVQYDILQYIMKNISFSKKLKKSMKIGLDKEVYFSMSKSSGTGKVDFESIYDQQVELLSTMTISSENTSYSFSQDGAKGIEWSAEIDEYNSISASISGVSGLYTEYEYTITTRLGKNKTVSTTFGLKDSSDSNNNPPPLPQLDTESATLGMKLALSALLIATLAEDVFTAGAGIVDTAPVVVAWLAAFGLS